MATIFLYKRACEDYFLHARLRAVERVATLAWEVGRTLVCVARAVERERTPEDIPTGYTIGYTVLYAYVLCIRCRRFCIGSFQIWTVNPGRWNQGRKCPRRADELSQPRKGRSATSAPLEVHRPANHSDERT